MNLTFTIESAESQFKQILEEFFIAVYSDKSISSHGIDHHRRVWSYSKELLLLIPPENNLQIQYVPSKLIIACYMHDIGISVDSGIKHGIHSKNLCIQFLVKNNLDENDYYDVLDAIENHDNKDYSSNRSVNFLLKILSLADDLDAFGFTGIYRFAEIYLTRGIDPEKIGYQITDNAEKRFSNFVRTFGFGEEIVEKHKKRYEVLNNFFINYSEQLPYYHFGAKNPSGYCGVVDLFIMMIKDKIEFKKFFRDSGKYFADPIISWYFSELEKELYSV